jgi:FixJ family two-component response regulator
VPESAGTQVIMTEQVLLVDDEPAVLDGYRRLLGRSFQLETAEGAVEALARFQAGSSYAVVVSDMRMPEMNGVQFLTKVRSLCPDTVRIMLTGNADIETAVHAVNDGNIFRFLTKPCTKELISTTLMAAIEQYHLIVSEKELLENTLRGSIRVLTEVLSLVNPAAFSRSMRVRRYVQQIATFLRLEKSWQFDVAAMMSQLGCVTLDPETVDAMYANSKLAPEEQSRYDQHPAVAAELLNKIPRMEAIAWMIAHQNNPSAELPNTPEARVMRTGAEILGAALAFDEALNKGVSKDDALSQVHTRFRQLKSGNPSCPARPRPGQRTDGDQGLSHQRAIGPHGSDPGGAYTVRASDCGRRPRGNSGAGAAFAEFLRERSDSRARGGQSAARRGGSAGGEGLHYGGKLSGKIRSVPDPVWILGRPNSPPPELLNHKVLWWPGSVNPTKVPERGTPRPSRTRTRLPLSKPPLARGKSLFLQCCRGMSQTQSWLRR